MRDVATGQSRHGNNRDRTASRELNGFLVNLGQIGIQGTRHGVFRRNLVHTVGDYCQSIRIVGHVGEQHQHLFVLLHSKIFGRTQGHIRDQDAFYGGVFRRIDETDNTIQRTGVAKRILKEEIIVIRHTHAAQDNLIGLGPQGYHCHYLVERLVGVGEERDLLPGHQRVVQVDTGNTRSNQFGWLLAANGIHGRTTNFDIFTFGYRTAIDRITIRVEETAGQLVTHLQGRSLSHEHDFSIRTDTFRTGKDLQGHFIADNLYHLSQFAVNRGQLVIPNPRCFQRTGRFCNLGNLCIYFLKSLHKKLRFLIVN